MLLIVNYKQLSFLFFLRHAKRPGYEAPQLPDPVRYMHIEAYNHQHQYHTWQFLSKTKYTVSMTKNTAARSS